MIGLQTIAMKQLRNTVIRAGLDALYFTGAHHLLRPWLAGVGTIFMLHHVRPARDDMFQPNRHLEITPDFLSEVLAHVRALDVDIVSLDEAHRRMSERDFARRFACFTFDDGYRDNRDFAYPIFKRHRLPFAIYVPTDFPDGKADLWWPTLERILREAPHITLAMDGEGRHFPLATIEKKEAAYREIYWWLRSIPEELARAAVAELAAALHSD